MKKTFGLIAAVGMMPILVLEVIGVAFKISHRIYFMKNFT